MGVNSSFPFIEWKFMRRLSRRRGQVLIVVHGVRISQYAQAKKREVQTGIRKKITRIASNETVCAEAVHLHPWRLSRTDQIML